MSLSETKDLCHTHHYIPDTGKKDPLLVQESVRLSVRRPEYTFTQPSINTFSRSYPFASLRLSANVSVGLLVGTLRLFTKMMLQCDKLRRNISFGLQIVPELRVHRKIKNF